jgi:PKD domain
MVPPLPANYRAMAQDMNLDSGNSGGMMAPLAGGPPPDPTQPPPMRPMRIMQPITGSMSVSPPYGIAPLRVGFFVLANDPDGIGFLTYSWNFGDGTVSALPPELYIFHTYSKPGTYVCTLTIKTVDGRSKVFVQGVDVQAPA